MSGELIEVDENDVTYCERRWETEGRIHLSFSQLTTENFVCAHNFFIREVHLFIITINKIYTSILILDFRLALDSNAKAAQRSPMMKRIMCSSDYWSKVSCIIDVGQRLY
jgi:hypothetical protein